jgi:UDP-glucose 4-epimerase
MKSILVTGATGAVAPQVVKSLHDAGYRLRVLVHRKPLNAAMPPGIEFVPGDITDPDSMKTAVQGMNYIVHMAALLHVVNPRPESRAEYYRINVDGVRIISEQAYKCGVDRMILFSTIAVYGRGNGRLLTEDSPLNPDTLYGETKLAAERIVIASQRQDGLPMGVVLRLAAVYGADVKGNYRTLVHALARGRFVPLGKGDNRRTVVYDKDVAQATLLALESPIAIGKVYNVTDGETHTVRAINHTICNALGRHPPRVYLPLKPVQIVISLLEKAAYLLGRTPPISRAMIDKYVEDVAVDGSLIQSELGFRPAYNLDSGWREAIREMRQQGDL